MYLKQNSDSINKFTSNVLCLNASLETGGILIDHCIIITLFMRSLEDQFDLLKQDCVLNSSKCVNMSLDHLEQMTTHFSSSMKLIKDENINAYLLYLRHRLH